MAFFHHRLASMLRSLGNRSVAKRRRDIDRLLAAQASARGDDMAVHFDTLQSQYGVRPEYGYDSFSTWKRGADRAQHLLGLSAMQSSGRRVLEVACGDGMTGFLLSGYGHDVQLTDVFDWRDERAREVAFTASDVCDSLPFADASYDLVYSYNAFEHFPDPASALAEIVRVCRPGGVMYLEFGPLYASPWGLHAYRMLRMPYPQFLFSSEFIQEELQKLGIHDLGQELQDLQFTNQWRVDQFHALWEGSKCEIVDEHVYRDVGHLNLVKRFPQCFQARGLTYDDLTIQSVYVTLRKPVCAVRSGSGL